MSQFSSDILLMTTGGVHRVAPISQEPSVHLYQWSIKRMKEGSFFVGTTARDGGRVSTDIQTFDPDTMRGVTASGRVYELVGPGGTPSRDAQYVWDYYKRVNELTELEEATVEGIGAC